MPPPPNRAVPGGAIGDKPPKGIPMGLACIIPWLIPGAPIPTLIGIMPIPGCIMLSMGLGTGLVRRPLRPREEGCGEMEAMLGATPKGLELAGVGETPLLEMVLPGVTAMPGAGDEPVEPGEKHKFAYWHHYLRLRSSKLLNQTTGICLSLYYIYHPKSDCTL